MSRSEMKDNGCIEWVGASCRGYGSITLHGEKYKTHRVMYEEMFGDIPRGLFVCHTCDNPSCVNPEHLFLGSQLDNMRDMIAKGRQPDRSGENNPRSKLSKEDVLLIRRLAEEGTPRQKLSVMFDIGETQTRNIINKKQWS